MLSGVLLLYNATLHVHNSFFIVAYIKKTLQGTTMAHQCLGTNAETGESSVYVETLATMEQM